MESSLNIRPLVGADRRAAARVYVVGLGDEEVRPLMPRHPESAVDVLSELIRADGNSWVAEVDGELIGLALCQEPSDLPPSMVSWRTFRRHLPLAAAVRARLVSNYLYKVHLRENEMYLQSLVVSSPWQGRGVGEGLVRHVCDVARGRGFTRVTLSVVDGNDRARSLYQRLGFQRVLTSRTGLFRPLVGWGSIDLMEKPVAQAREEHSHLNQSLVAPAASLVSQVTQPAEQSPTEGM